MPIKRIKIDGWTQKQWLEWRRLNGVGGSEVSTVMGLNAYQSALELFYNKIDTVDERVQSQAAFFGKLHEDMISDVWRYWDGTPEGMIANYNSGTVIRECKRINAILQNPKTPYLFASIDRVFAKPKKGILECKTISGYVEKQWREGVPPGYVMQVQSYMLTSELTCAEMAILSNGNRFQVLKFDADYELMKVIANKCAEFWARVLEARPIAEKLKLEGKLVFESPEIQRMEPEPDGSDAWTEYLNERFKSHPIEREGNFLQREWAEAYVDHKRRENINAEEAEKFKNKLCVSMRDVEKITFGAAGHVTWKPDSTGKRRFGVYLKKEYNERK